MSNEVLRVGDDGEVYKESVEDSSTQSVAAMDEIIKSINDPNAPLAPIKRAIAVEIAKANRALIEYSGQITSLGALDTMRVKALDSQVKALRELGKELMESDVLSKKDFLNFDGPKLAYVLDEFRQGAMDTLRKIGIDDGTAQQFLRQWRDVMMEREPQIRRSVDKLEFETTEKK